MARVTDNFDAVDADDLLRPVRNPAQLTVVWEGVEPATYKIPLTFTQTAFNGRRVSFLCPHCKERSRKLYAVHFNRVLWCRRCLGLRYRSQQRQKPLPDDIRFLQDVMRTFP